MGLGGFIESIEQWELLNIKEVKPGGRRAEGGRGTPAGGGAARPSEIKGVATILRPEELTASIQAHEMTMWTEQWAAFRDNSAFGTQGDAAILAYLKQCVSREILLAVAYRERSLGCDKTLLRYEDPPQDHQATRDLESTP